MNKFLREYLISINVDPATVENNPELLNFYTQQALSGNQFDIDAGVSTRAQRRFNRQNQNTRFIDSFSQSLLDGQNNNTSTTSNTNIDNRISEAVSNDISNVELDRLLQEQSDTDIDTRINQAIANNASNEELDRLLQEQATQSNSTIDRDNLATQTSTTTSVDEGVDQNTTNNFLSQAALLGNVFGAGVSLDSAAFSLGRSIGFQGEQKGANLARGIGAGAKLLLGATRQGLAGFGTERRNQFLLDFQREQARRARQGDFIGNPQSVNITGNLPFRDGGEIKDFKPHSMFDPETNREVRAETFDEHVFYTEKGFVHEDEFRKGGKVKKKKTRYEDGGLLKYQDGGEVQIGDFISFTDEAGNIQEGRIKKIENGQIFL